MKANNFPASYSTTSYLTVEESNFTKDQNQGEHHRNQLAMWIESFLEDNIHVESFMTMLFHSAKNQIKNLPVDDTWKEKLTIELSDERRLTAIKEAWHKEAIYR